MELMPRKEVSKPGEINEKLAIESEIRFYRANEKPYGTFSNLYPRTVEFDGEVFLTAEHAYQAGKAAKKAVREWVLSAPNPALVAMAAHGLYSWDVVPNWATIKFDRMRRVLFAKYRQHDDLRILLLSTGEARLVESAKTNNAVNRLWGEVNGKGENMLGKLLMEVRAELRKELDEQKSARKPPRDQKSTVKATPKGAKVKVSRLQKVKNA
jgi:ribA/ribD-fused uncharacterized protein